MNATFRRFQCRVEMVSLLVLVYPNRAVEVSSSHTAGMKKSKVPISELILHQITKDKKPIFLLITKKYKSEVFEACYITILSYIQNKVCILGTAQPDIWFIPSQKRWIKYTRLSCRFLLRWHR